MTNEFLPSWRLGRLNYCGAPLFRPLFMPGMRSHLDSRRSFFPQHLAEFGGGRAHLRFDGADWAALEFGDLLVRQTAVLAEQEHLPLFRPQIQYRPLQPFPRFPLFGALDRTGSSRLDE